MPKIPANLEFFFENDTLQATWDASSVPEGFSVHFSFLDEHHKALDPQPTVVYDVGHAVISDPRIKPHVKFTAQAHLMSDWTDPEEVVIEKIPPPGPVRAFWRAGALWATWTAPDTSAKVSYRWELRTSDGKALSPQPASSATGATGCKFEGEALADKAMLVVAVQSEVDKSRSTWTLSPRCAVDKTGGGEARLVVLEEALRAASSKGNGAFELTSAIIGEPSISSLFKTLLNLPSDSIALSGAQVTRGDETLTLTATASYPFAASVVSSFEFTAPAGRLALVLRADSVGGFTVRQLVATGIIPASPFEGWDSPLAPFPRISMLLDSSTQIVTFGGDPTATPWSIDMGPAKVSMGTVTPDFQVVAPTKTELTDYRPFVNTILSAGTVQIPVRLGIPHGSQGWTIAMGSKAVPIGELNGLDSLMGADSGLPASVIALGSFQLDNLQMDFAPVDPRVWHLSAEFSISADKEWTVAKGLVHLQRLTAAIDLTMYGVKGAQVAARGSLHGMFVLADKVSIAVGVSLPARPEGLLITGSASVSDFSLSTLAPYVGGSASPLTDFVAKLGTVGSLGLRDIAILVPADDQTAIRRLSLVFEVSNWTIPALSWFAVKNISLALDIDKPLTADKVITGSASADLQLGGLSLATVFDFTADRWSLELQATAGRLTGVEALNPILPSTEIQAFLPKEIDSNAGCVLGGFTLIYNTAKSYVESGTLLLESDYVWEWLGGSLQLSDLAIDLQFSRDASTSPLKIDGSIAGTITVADVPILLKASRPTGAEDWTFNGTLGDQLELDFNAILGTLLPGVQIPSGYGFPTSLTFTQAWIETTPATAAVDFQAESMVEWSIGFGKSALALTMLGCEVHLPAGVAEKTGLITANFTLGTLDGYAEVSLGTGSTDLLVKTTISEGKNPSASSIADSVIGAGTYQSIAAPATFLKPDSFAEASMTVNVTQKVLLVTGKYLQPDSRYGAMTLLVKPKAAGDLGFVLAAELGKWTPADLSPVLAGTDTAIGLELNKAAVVLATVDGNAEPLLTDLVHSLPAGIGLQPGLNLYVQLNFTTGLLNNIRSILQIEGPYTLTAVIPSDPKATVTMSAELKSLTLLSTLQFQNIRLIYTSSTTAGRALKLTGSIVAKFDKDYTFAGEMEVSSTNATFLAQTTQSIVNPLGIPNLTLNSLGLKVMVTYGENAQIANTYTAFSGSITFGSAVLRGWVALEKMAPKMVVAELVGIDQRPVELSLASLFQNMTGLKWPDMLDLKLSDGEISWNPGKDAVSWQGRSYASGIHARGNVTIFFLPALTLDAAIVTNAAKAEENGLTVEALFAKPVDWGFIKFTGTAQHGGAATGPYVSINTRNNGRPFGMGAGIVMLGSAVGDIDIEVGKDSMKGSFTLPASAGIFAGRRVDFIWANNKFMVENWSLPELNLPKFNFTNLRGSGLCSQIILSLLPVDSKFNLHASLGITPGSGDQPATLDFTLSGTFDLEVTSLAYKNDPILTAKIVDATLPVPMPASGSFDWSALSNAFIKAIQDASQSMMDHLLKDPVNLAKLSAVAGGRWGIASAIEYLVCRGMSLVEATAAVMATISGLVSEITAVCAGGALILVGGQFVKVISDEVTNSPGTKKDPDRDPNTDPETTPAPERPVQPTLHFDTDMLVIDWTGSSTQNVTEFRIALRSTKPGMGGGRVTEIPIASVSKTNTSIADSQLNFGELLEASIVAVGPGGQSLPSEPGKLSLIGAPDLFLVEFRGSDLAARWHPVQGVGQYEAQVADADGKSLNPAPTVAIVGVTATFSSPALLRAGDVQVKVRGKSRDGWGPWSRALGMAIRAPLPPLDVHVRSEGSMLIAEWTPIPAVTNLYTSVLTAGGETLLPYPSILHLPDDRGTTIQGAGIVDGAQLILAFNASAKDAAGTPVRVPITVRFLSAPVMPMVTFSNPEAQVAVQWTPVSNAAGYSIEIRDAQGLPIPNPPAITMTDGTTAKFSSATLIKGSSYQVAVRATGPSVMSDWSSANFTLTILPVPSYVKLINDLVYMVAAWEDLPQPLIYELVVMTEGSVVMDPQPSITFVGPNATIDAAQMKVGTNFTVKVRGVLPGIIGAWSVPVSLIRELPKS